MRRLPIRLRLTLGFTLAMALLLAATSVFLYFRLAATLDETVEDALEARADELVPLLAQGELRLSGAFDEEDRFIQVLAGPGAARAATPGVGLEPVLSSAELERVRAGPIFVERESVRGIDGSARLLATPVGDEVLVVGASLADRNEALAGLLGELALVEPVALLLAALLGYGLATAALLPVESMRAEAAAISAAEPGRRLSLSPTKDEVSRLGETLNAMLGRLESALERERSFVAEASHELRTPLALLKAELELASGRPRSQAELEQVLRSAAEETDRLAQLADDLLVLARSDAGHLQLLRTTVSVADLFATVTRRFRSRAEHAGRTIQVQAPASLSISADRLRLEQALGNLVENAFRHGDGSVRVLAREQAESVELHVEDDGPGFPSEFLPRAFERFGRADDARPAAGAGLGLAIVEVIAAAHGGSAHAANRDGGGADVAIVIPSDDLARCRLDAQSPARRGR
ncbi:MAG: HAMP domain-containing protein [Actinobacteria bacterium]|nr:HAMP domain-containing protein [Actinomycetota bacterium]